MSVTLRELSTKYVLPLAVLQKDGLDFTVKSYRWSGRLGFTVRLNIEVGGSPQVCLTCSQCLLKLTFLIAKLSNLYYTCYPFKEALSEEDWTQPTAVGLLCKCNDSVTSHPDLCVQNIQIAHLGPRWPKRYDTMDVPKQQSPLYVSLCATNRRCLAQKKY